MVDQTSTANPTTSSSSPSATASSSQRAATIPNLPGVTFATTETAAGPIERGEAQSADVMDIGEEKADDGLFGDENDGGVTVEDDGEKEKEKEKGGREQEQDAEEGEEEKEEDDEMEKALEIYGRSLSYIDYLQSPIVALNVGSPPTGTTFYAHLALLQRSPYFVEAFSSCTLATPAASRQISLPDTELDPIGCFLQYLYTGEYTPRLVPTANNSNEFVLEIDPDLPPEQQLDEEGTHLLKHAKVYTLANRFGIDELMDLAHKKIHRINSTAKGELAYARYVYANTSKEDKIREPIATFWAHRSHVLRHEAEDEFRSMVMEFPQFAYDILSMVLDQKEKGKERERLHSREDRDGTEQVTPTQPEKAPGRVGGRKRPRLSTTA